VLQAIVRRAYDTQTLDGEAARAVIYSLGLVGPGPNLADETLVAARFSKKELDRVRRGLPSPVGCARLRRIEPSARCSCFPGDKVLPYATPALFAVGQVAPAEPRWKPFAPFLERDQDLVQNPFEQVGETLARIESRLQALEGKRGDP
ncbi:MAG: hypothetical protein WCI05_18285, partial [Myxococcales bacterium]